MKKMKKMKKIRIYVNKDYTYTTEKFSTIRAAIANLRERKTITIHNKSLDETLTLTVTEHDKIEGYIVK